MNALEMRKLGKKIPQTVGDGELRLPFEQDRSDPVATLLYYTSSSRLLLRANYFMRKGNKVDILLYHSCNFCSSKT